MDKVARCIELLIHIRENTATSETAYHSGARLEARSYLEAAESQQREFNALFESLTAEEQVRVCEWDKHCS